MMISPNDGGTLAVKTQVMPDRVILVVVDNSDSKKRVALKMTKAEAEVVARAILETKRTL